MSKNLHSVNNSGFHINFMNMVEQNNPSTLDPDCQEENINLGDTQTI